MATSVLRLPLIPLAESAVAATNTSERYRHLFSLGVEAISKDREDGGSQTLQPLEPLSVRELPTAPMRLSMLHNAQLQHMTQRSDGLDARTVFAIVCQYGARQEALDMAQARRQDELLRQQIQQERQHQQQQARAAFTPQSHEQGVYYENVLTGLMAGKIVMAEGSTGIGKSRVMAVSAIDLVRAGRGRVVIAAPTVAVMEHIYEEFCRVRESGGGDGVKVAVLPGATEFVDDRKLQEYLLLAQEQGQESGAAALPLDTEVAQWVRYGAPPLRADRPMVKALESTGEEVAWLMDDLAAMATDIPARDFALTQNLSADGSARQLLAKARAHAAQANIILCTHAMLGVGLRTKWALLPPPDVLMIDEAHTLEANLSLVFSDRLSMHTLRSAFLREARRVKQKTGGKCNSVERVQKALREVTILLKQMDPGNEVGQSLRLNRDMEDVAMLDRIRGALKALGERMGGRALDSIDGMQGYRAAVHSLCNALQGDRYGDRVDLEFSPDRRYPSLLCGPFSLASRMRMLWKEAQNGVLLTSATLCTMDAHGHAKADYVRNLLAVDLDRLVVPAPVVDPQIYQLPQVHVPGKQLAARIRPPRITFHAGGMDERSSRESREWLTQLCDVLRTRVLDSAAGGTMVLLTSYQQIDDISDLLEQGGLDVRRIVKQSRDRKFAVSEAQFRKVHAEGLKPVLLALGAGWTGVDLKDHDVPAQHDFLLTDLVIARLPIGLNSSNSMKTRIERTGMYPIVQEALLMLKQGIGRLIRRHDVSARRLWMLDGRPFCDEGWSGMDAMMGAVRRQMREYAKVATLD